jgi:hypothetical protein
MNHSPQKLKEMTNQEYIKKFITYHSPPNTPGKVIPHEKFKKVNNFREGSKETVMS